MVKCGRSKKRLTIVIISIVFFFAVCILYLRLAVAPVLKTVSEDQIRALAVTAVNEAVSEVMEQSPSYTDMVIIGYDNENCINSIRINSTAVNSIVQKSTIESQNRITELGSHGIDVPVGSLSGIMLFSGKGPDLNLRVVPVGSVTAKLCSEFKEAGINQTNHRIYLRIGAKISAILPGANNVINTETDVVILESVIIGKIPDTYLNSTSTEDMMDLIP